MSPSEEVLISIENRLRELEQEIVALQSARAELQASDKPPRRKPSPGKPRRARKAPAAPELSDEEWVARRAAELAAQSRAAAA